MTAHPSGIYTTPEDYLQSETQSLIRHEYVRGELYAMAGGSDAHDEIALISQDKMNIECFRRNACDQWEAYAFGRGDVVEFTSIGLRSEIAIFYEDVSDLAVPDSMEP